MTLAKDESSVRIWRDAIPSLAFKNDALLYSILYLSALHLAIVQPGNPANMVAYREYLDLAIRAHTKDLAQLSKENADVVCLTSTFHRVGAFAILQERQLKPYYTPPLNWLQMCKGTERVFRATWNWIKNDESSIAIQIIKRPPILPPIWTGDEPLFGEQNRLEFMHLLRASSEQSPSEPWDKEVYEAYASTISYVGSVQKAIAAGEESSRICRRLIAFPMLIQQRFIDLVDGAQPRALVVLAHYFSIAARFKNIWWLGDTGQREVLGIQSVLPVEWRDLLQWPLKTMHEPQFEINATSIFTAPP
ncbi:hypothetical protein ACLMJK_000428 [Lecanora helva]